MLYEHICLPQFFVRNHMDLIEGSKARFQELHNAHIAIQEGGLKEAIGVFLNGFT